MREERILKGLFSLSGDEGVGSAHAPKPPKILRSQSQRRGDNVKAKRPGPSLREP